MNAAVFTRILRLPGVPLRLERAGKGLVLGQKDLITGCKDNSSGMALVYSSHESPFSHKALFGEDHPTQGKSTMSARKSTLLIHKSRPKKALAASSTSVRKQKPEATTTSVPAKEVGCSSTDSVTAVEGGCSQQRRGRQMTRPGRKLQPSNEATPTTLPPSLSVATSLCPRPSGSPLVRVSDSSKVARTRTCLLHGTRTPTWKLRRPDGTSSTRANQAHFTSAGAEVTVEATAEKGKAGETKSASPGSVPRVLSAATRARLARSSTTEVLLAFNKPPTDRLNTGTGGVSGNRSGGVVNSVSTRSNRIGAAAAAAANTRPQPHMRVPRRAFESASRGRGRKKAGGPLTSSDIARGLSRLDYRHVIVMSGAGISTASGIPDFRTPGSGLYDNLQRYSIPYPEAIFDISYFVQNPRPFYTLARELYPGNYAPNPVHHFVRLLQDKGVLLRNYTQNIDGLERLAGVQAGQLVEAHGSFAMASCTRCGSKQDPEEVKATIMKERFPRCKHKRCLGLVKPDIVFFGEDLPQRFYSLRLSDFSKCDLLIIMGTSLEVEPFASLLMLPHCTVPRLLVNREPVGPFKHCKGRTTDVAVTGDLVEGVRGLAREAGWGKELEALVAGAGGSVDVISTAVGSVHTASEGSFDSTEDKSSKSLDSCWSVQSTLSDQDLASAVSAMTITSPVKARSEYTHSRSPMDSTASDSSSSSTTERSASSDSSSASSSSSLSSRESSSGGQLNGRSSKRTGKS